MSWGMAPCPPPFKGRSSWPNVYDTHAQITSYTDTEIENYLFTVESLGRVERLDKRGGMTNEQSVARGSGQHTDHGQPYVRCTLWRVSAKPNAQHVWQRLKQRPRVLFGPIGMLQCNMYTVIIKAWLFGLTSEWHLGSVAKPSVMTALLRFTED